MFTHHLNIIAHKMLQSCDFYWFIPHNIKFWLFLFLFLLLFVGAINKNSPYFTRTISKSGPVLFCCSSWKSHRLTLTYVISCSSIHSVLLYSAVVSQIYLHIVRWNNTYINTDIGITTRSSEHSPLSRLVFNPNRLLFLLLLIFKSKFGRHLLKLQSWIHHLILTGNWLTCLGK